jgi:type I restriction enzyme R subunit
MSALKLTAYTIKSLVDPKLVLGAGEAVKIDPTEESGSGQVQDKSKIALAELIAKVNDLFECDPTPNDKLVYVNDVIKGKLMESEKLAEQALHNTKEQFANSPDLAKEILGAVMDELSAHGAMSKQALESDELRADMKDVLLGAGRLYEGLRAKALGDVMWS